MSSVLFILLPVSIAYKQSYFSLRTRIKQGRLKYSLCLFSVFLHNDMRSVNGPVEVSLPLNVESIPLFSIISTPVVE